MHNIHSTLFLSPIKSWCGGGWVGSGVVEDLDHKRNMLELLLWLRRLWTWLVCMRLWVWSLALLSGLRIRHCRELWCRTQMWLRSGVAVAVALAGSCSSDSTSSLGTSICHTCSYKKKTNPRGTCRSGQSCFLPLQSPAQLAMAGSPRWG